MTKKEHQRSIARIIKAVEDRDVLIRARRGKDSQSKIQTDPKNFQPSKSKSKREKLKKDANNNLFANAFFKTMKIFPAHTQCRTA